MRFPTKFNKVLKELYTPDEIKEINPEKAQLYNTFFVEFFRSSLFSIFCGSGLVDSTGACNPASFNSSGVRDLAILNPVNFAMKP